MFVRIQHIDGTLEPAVPIDGSELLEEIGTSFAMPDGRWVRVIGHARQEDGALRYAIVGETPERRTYSAAGHQAYVHDASEMRMGSPQYGTLMVDGSPLDVGAPVDEASLLWSHDGRYLAATVLDGSIAYPGTKVIVIDSETRTVIGSSQAQAGLGAPLEFVGRSLSYHHWHHIDGDTFSYLAF
jgi:hypothetical protein